MIMDNKTTVSANMEIQKMLHKLRDLIPGIPPNRKMTKLEIMQHVIDYITELEEVLAEQDPQAVSTLAATFGEAYSQAYSTEMVN